MPLLLALLLAAGSPGATPASPAARAPAPRPAGLAQDVVLLPGPGSPGSMPAANTLVLHGSTGLVVVDPGDRPEQVRAVRELARSLSLPVTAIVNTRWHREHAGNDAALREAFPDAGVVASDPAEVQRPGEERLPAPAFVLRQDVMRRVGGRPAELGLERHAVDPSNVWLFDRPTGVLASGDLVSLPVPLLDGACPEGWRAALGHLAEVPFQVLVPGHGPPLRRRDFYAWRAAFEHLLACGASPATPAACAEGWVKDLGPLLPPEDAPLARASVEKAVTSALRGPPEARARACGEAGSVR